MERNHQKDPIRQQKEAYETGINRHNAECDEARTAPEYLKSRAEWTRFCKGEINAQELERNLKGDAGSSEFEKIRDFFEGEEV